MSQWLAPVHINTDGKVVGEYSLPDVIRDVNLLETDGSVTRVVDAGRDPPPGLLPSITRPYPRPPAKAIAWGPGHPCTVIFLR